MDASAVSAHISQAVDITPFELSSTEKEVFLHVLGSNKSARVGDTYAVWPTIDAAKAFLNHFQKVLDNWRDRDAALSKDVDMETMHRRGARLLVKISQHLHIFSSSLLVAEVKLESPDPVAAGGFADIYRAMYLGTRVCLKRLKLYTSQTDYGEMLKKFTREALLWRQLKHPNVLTFIGIHMTTSDIPCMIAPWMEKGSIKKYLRDVRPTYKLIQRLSLEIADGLLYLHKHSIVHGDLRGDNILIDAEEHVQLADFGIALNASETATQATGVQGAWRWMAPELFQLELGTCTTEAALTPAIDVYAFACVMFELHTLKVPFYDISNPAAVISHIMAGNQPNRPSNQDCEVDISHAVWRFMELCWTREVEKRPSSEDIRKQLEECYWRVVFWPVLREKELCAQFVCSSSNGKLDGDYVVCDARTPMPLPCF